MGSNWSNQNDSDDDSDEDLYSEEEEEIISVVPPENMSHTYQQQEGDLALDAFGNICLDSATDAVTAQSTSTMPITLNIDQVFTTENKLDIYEKVSLVYLLYDDSNLALQELCKLLSGEEKQIIYKWAKNQNLISQQTWQEKFVEALCIIQNYQVVKNLGYQRKDLDERFLPHHPFAVLYVDKVKKGLYFLCEDLTSADSEKLLNKVNADFQRKNMNFKYFDAAYLELYLLYWETVGYIKRDNLSNLCSILKQLELFDWDDRLKQLAPIAPPTTQIFNTQKSKKTVDANTSKQSLKIFEGILNETSLMDLVSLESSPISADNIGNVKDDKRYSIDPRNPGVCLIINQENFYTEIDKKYQHLLPGPDNKLDPRKGTEKDKQDLEATFKMFNFKTEVVDNLTHTEINEKIHEVLGKITNESSLFICIMSHGDEGVIYGVNSCRVTVRQIQNMMCTINRPNLLGKPKILILQSCQGTRCQKISSVEDHDDYVTTDGPSFSKQEIIPPRADLFTFWATVPGYGAIRDKRTGSWFIQSLCENMKNLGNRFHFEDICTAVVGDVSSKKWSQKTEDVAMVPLKDSTLRKRFYLPPIQQL